MKRRFLCIILAAPLLCFTACEKKHTPEEVRQTLRSGTWHVSFYSVNGTPSFALDDYDFTFSADGTAKADANGTHVTGTWTVSEINKENVIDLYLGHSSPFDQLDNDWKVYSLFSGRVETENDDNGTVYLTFEKN